MELPVDGFVASLSVRASILEGSVKASRIEQGVRPCPCLQIRPLRRSDLHLHVLGNCAEVLSKQVEQRIRSSFRSFVRPRLAESAVA